MNGISTLKDLAQHPLDGASDLSAHPGRRDNSIAGVGGHEEREGRHGARQ